MRLPHDESSVAVEGVLRRAPVCSSAEGSLVISENQLMVVKMTVFPGDDGGNPMKRFSFLLTNHEWFQMPRGHAKALSGSLEAKQSSAHLPCDINNVIQTLEMWWKSLETLRQSGYPLNDITEVPELAGGVKICPWPFRHGLIELIYLLLEGFQGQGRTWYTAWIRDCGSVYQRYTHPVCYSIQTLKYSAIARKSSKINLCSLPLYVSLAVTSTSLGHSVTNSIIIITGSLLSNVSTPHGQAVTHSILGRVERLWYHRPEWQEKFGFVILLHTSCGFPYCLVFAGESGVQSLPQAPLSPQETIGYVWKRVHCEYTIYYSVYII